MDQHTDQRPWRGKATQQNGANRSIEDRFKNYLDELNSRNRYTLGYPAAKDFSYGFLVDFLDLPLNNVGDPYVAGHYGINTKTFEREVIDFFASHFRAPPDDYWGYVTAGGTEGNFFSLAIARELYPDAVVLFSTATHYSVPKSCHLLRMEFQTIAVQSNDEIDYADLTARIHALGTLGTRAIIVVANIGTTMTEAKDDVKRIRTLLHEAGVERHFIHSDAALCGAFLHLSEYRGGFDLADGADSVAISGHKFIGAPMPCGVVITRRSLSEKARREVSYIGGTDSTLAGSRNGLTVLCLWYAIHQLGAVGLGKRFRDAEAQARMLQAALRDVGIPAWRNPHALTVVFPPVSSEIREKWQLATDERYSHLIVMPNTPPSMLDEFVADMRRDGKRG
jgi:histidine decarboxylase